MGPDAQTHRNVLVTGLPGCGKTTLIKTLARDLSRFRPAGFYTEEIRRQGQRTGFRLVGLNGSTGLLAHVDLGGRPRVARYGVEVGQLETFLEDQRLDRLETHLVLIDEIGKMECLSPRFVDLVRHLLDSPKIILATVALKGSGLIAEVKLRSDVLLVQATPENRDTLARNLAERVAAMVRD